MEDNLGLGVMINQLSGGSKHEPKEYIGKTIKSADVDDERVMIEFDDGTKIKLSDNGQSCCESRYITCDDEASDLIGSKLVDILTKPVDTIDNDEFEVHERVFIEIKTDQNSITLCTHNEHNGYYGGFALCIDEYE